MVAAGVNVALAGGPRQNGGSFDYAEAYGQLFMLHAWIAAN
jgi:hypothetical protein